jgi:hypothetical protein
MDEQEVPYQCQGGDVINQYPVQFLERGKRYGSGESGFSYRGSGEEEDKIQYQGFQKFFRGGLLLT